jgi:hypothetical protein
VIKTATTFPFKTAAGDAGVLNLFRKGTVSHFLARILRYELGFAGAARCRLRLSVGEVTVIGNRDTVPLTLNEGDCVSVRVMRSYREDTPALRVMRMSPATSQCGVAWLPTTLCHRTAHLKRLLTLLAQLDPSMQAFFMTAMADAQAQRRFFWRVAASDHHCYPGGLFDQAVDAAELAFAHSHADHAARSVAAMGALLFDIGKVFDEKLSRDTGRLQQVLMPHRLTRVRLKRAYEAGDVLEPALSAEPVELLRAVLEANPGSPVGGPPQVGQLASCVRAAVERAWSLSA